MIPCGYDRCVHKVPCPISPSREPSLTIAFRLLTCFFGLSDDNGVQVMSSGGGGVHRVDGGAGDGLLQLHARAYVVQILRAGSSLRASSAGQRRE